MTLSHTCVYLCLYFVTPYYHRLGCVCWITLCTNKPMCESDWSDPVVRTPTLTRHQMIFPACCCNKFIKRPERRLSHLGMQITVSFFRLLAPRYSRATSRRSTLEGRVGDRVGLTVVTRQGLSPNQARRDAAPQFPSHEYQTPAIFQLFHTKRCVSAPHHRGARRTITQQQNINAFPGHSVDTLTKKLNQEVYNAMLLQYEGKNSCLVSRDDRRRFVMCCYSVTTHRAT